MFKKILIANRGEIACRAMRTVRRMGIATVAVYSEADRDALHTRRADEAVLIGPPPAAESYLAIDRIIDACRQTGAEAVYPGYGFLSENAAFARRLAHEGIAFIGPGLHAIEVMGDKIASKKLAERAGVDTVPGYTGVLRDATFAVQIARELGYPVMLKASAGGGGKGMRVARDDAECRTGFERASNEARASFGDGRMFLERYIDEPRHIEIQVLADQHGNVLTLNERECSIQRRHQKIIEEAPSPFLDATTRAAMSEQARALAKAVDYQSAGTVEFIVDTERNFFFMEMNTRLQVEHPVTECITGLDLIELMIRVAAGEALPLAQTDIKLDGWALEARIYAENPCRDFLPSTGRLTGYRPPPQTASVRVDDGVFEGGEVSMFYDPMIAKLVTSGTTREGALQRMRQALNEYYVRGVDTNIPFLVAVMEHPRFVEGRLSTNFVGDEFPGGFRAGDLSPDAAGELVAVAATVHRQYMDRAAATSGQLKGYERVVENSYVVELGGRRYPVSVVVASGYEVSFDDTVWRVVSDWRFGEPLFRGRINDLPVCVQVARRGFRYRLVRHGLRHDITVFTQLADRLNQQMPVKHPPDLSRFLLSPMPGLLVSMAVQPGQAVKAGEVLAVVEAMKMENALTAGRDQVVVKRLAEPGATLETDQPILEFE